MNACLNDRMNLTLKLVVQLVLMNPKFQVLFLAVLWSLNTVSSMYIGSYTVPPCPTDTWVWVPSQWDDENPWTWTTSSTSTPTLSSFIPLDSTTIPFLFPVPQTPIPDTTTPLSEPGSENSNTTALPVPLTPIFSNTDTGASITTLFESTASFSESNPNTLTTLNPPFPASTSTSTSTSTTSTTNTNTDTGTGTSEAGPLSTETSNSDPTQNDNTNPGRSLPTYQIVIAVVCCILFFLVMMCYFSKHVKGCQCQRRKYRRDHRGRERLGSRWVVLDNVGTRRNSQDAAVGTGTGTGDGDEVVIAIGTGTGTGTSRTVEKHHRGTNSRNATKLPPSPLTTENLKKMNAVTTSSIPPITGTTTKVKPSTTRIGGPSHTTPPPLLPSPNQIPNQTQNQNVKDSSHNAEIPRATQPIPIHLPIKPNPHSNRLLPSHNHNRKQVRPKAFPRPMAGTTSSSRPIDPHLRRHGMLIPSYSLPNIPPRPDQLHHYPPYPYPYPYPRPYYPYPRPGPGYPLPIPIQPQSQDIDITGPLSSNQNPTSNLNIPVTGTRNTGEVPHPRPSRMDSEQPLQQHHQQQHPESPPLPPVPVLISTSETGVREIIPILKKRSSHNTSSGSSTATATARTNANANVGRLGTGGGGGGGGGVDSEVNGGRRRTMSFSSPSIHPNSSQNHANDTGFELLLNRRILVHSRILEDGGSGDRSGSSSSSGSSGDGGGGGGSVGKSSSDSEKSVNRPVSVNILQSPGILEDVDRSLNGRRDADEDTAIRVEENAEEERRGEEKEEGKEEERGVEDIVNIHPNIKQFFDTKLQMNTTQAGVLETETPTTHTISVNTGTLKKLTEELRKLKPPKPQEGTVNAGYNPVLDERRPEEMGGYLRTYCVLFVIDDSGSMHGKRWMETKSALSEISAHAVKRNLRSISIRFLNNTTYIKGVGSVNEIINCFDQVRPSGYTPTGPVLKEVLTAQINQLDIAKEDLELYKFEPPLTVIVITDGIPTGKTKPEHVIEEAYNQLREKKHHPNAISIQLVQIGNDRKADQFLNSLGNERVFMQGGTKNDNNSNFDWQDMVEVIPYTTYQEQEREKTGKARGVLTADMLESIILGGLHPNLRTYLNRFRF